MHLPLGSIDLNDLEFLQAAASGDLGLAQFRHGDHLRLAWLLVHQWPLNRAEDFARVTIQRFAERHGVSTLYNETITLAWIRLVATHHEDTFAEFLDRNRERLNRELLYRFWTPELLTSDEAKRQWVPPDREQLPGSACP
jgi:CDP-diacylglycerol--glycerol-3-phosphate 3-phosphatidyltransferase